MRQVKMGRGPSFMKGIAALGAAVFGIIWTMIVLNSGAPQLMALFGILFVLMGLGQAIYHLYNAAASRRMSVLDIAEDGEEDDPLNRAANPRFARRSHQQTAEMDDVGNRSVASMAAVRYCPYCGSKILHAAHRYCGSCGKLLSESR